jgi:hypothetical protein
MPHFETFGISLKLLLELLSGEPQPVLVLVDGKLVPSSYVSFVRCLPLKKGLMNLFSRNLLSA